MSAKTHFAVKPPFQASETSACGRGRGLHMTADVTGVTCGHCRKNFTFILRLEDYEKEKAAAFLAQVPRSFAEPWHQPYGKVPMLCKGCGGDQFRHGDRTCHGHYDNWHCANCGHVESRLTETGMCF